MRPRLLSMADAPVDGVSEVQTLELTGDPTGGTFTITFDGEETSDIPFDATAGQVEAYLTALPNIGNFNVVVTGGPLPAEVTITYSGDLAGMPVAEITADVTNLTGDEPFTGGATIATATAGVRGSFRGAPSGVYLQDTTNGTLYVNAGSRAVPSWTDVGVS